MHEEHEDEYVDQPESLSTTGTGYDYVPTTADIGMPRIRLAQALTKEVTEQTARMGQWIIPGIGVDDLVVFDVMGMKLKRDRTIRINDERKVLCEADSARGIPLVGVGDPGLPCESCPFAQWTGEEKTNRKPPECTLGWEYLVRLENGTIATLGMTEKSAGRAAMQLNTMYLQTGPTPGALRVTLGSERIEKGQRRYVVPVVRESKVITAGGPRMIEALGRTVSTNSDGAKTSVQVEEMVLKGPGGKDPEATPKQMKYLWATAREMGLTDEQVEDMVKENFEGRSVKELNRREMSTLIEMVQEDRNVLSG